MHTIVGGWDTYCGKSMADVNCETKLFWSIKLTTKAGYNARLSFRRKQPTKRQSGSAGQCSGKRGSYKSERRARSTEKAWMLWRDRFERATWWMSVSPTYKLDFFLLFGGEELQKLIEHYRNSLRTTSCTSRSLKQPLWSVTKPDLGVV